MATKKHYPPLARVIILYHIYFNHVLPSFPVKVRYIDHFSINRRSYIDDNTMPCPKLYNLIRKKLLIITELECTMQVENRHMRLIILFYNYSVTPVLSSIGEIPVTQTYLREKSSSLEFLSEGDQPKVRVST